MRRDLGHAVVVFLGPTLREVEARACLDASYRPPAEQGSIVRAVRSHDPGAIVLIDGAFATAPAVRHKELLWALSRGIVVYGAASMGALRAAELAAFGMQGYGYIYRRYRLIPLIDDDEVAVAMSPVELGAQPLSEALINMRLTLRRGQRWGTLSPALRAALDGIAQAMHFPDRSYARLLLQARAALSADQLPSLDRFERWLPDHAVDQKRADAVGLLRLLAREPERLARRAAAPFQMTEAWAYDLQAAGFDPADIADAGRRSSER